MRVVIFKIFLLLLLLGGGHNFYANKLNQILTSSSDREISQRRHDRFSNKNHSAIIAEDNDVDIEEEHVGGQLKSTGNNDTSSKKSIESYFLYVHHAHPTVLKRYSKSLRISSAFVGHINPLYISLQVLRI